MPEPVREAARKAVPGVKLDEAWKNLDREGKLHSYEIRGRNPADGKIREVRVSLTGEILEIGVIPRAAPRRPAARCATDAPPTPAHSIDCEADRRVL